MSEKNTQCELILALDLDSYEEVEKTLKKIGAQLKWVKIGLQLFTKYGPQIVHKIHNLGYKIFLDLKLHDIPNTVASAVGSLKELPVDLLSIHASGGSEMIEWSKKIRDDMNLKLKLIGITVLTSFNEASLKSIGIHQNITHQVEHLGKLGMNAGLDGLVCSPHELHVLRKSLGTQTVLVVPGIRPHGTDSNEQKRTMTPREAAHLGASFIVVGRPILNAQSPQKAVQEILNEINQS